MKRAATVVNSRGRHEIVSEEFESEPAEIAPLKQFIYEPDNAVVRSHLIGQLAEQIDLGQFGVLGAQVIPGDQAFMTKAETKCALWK